MKKIQLWKSNPDEPEKEKMSRKHSLLAIIFSVLVAIVFWFFVQGVQSPDYSSSFSSVAVGVRSLPDGLSVISGDGAVCEVKLTGRRSDLNKIRSTDLEAYLDLSAFTKAGTYEVEVSVLTPAGATLNSVNPQKVTVELDTTLAVEVPVEVDLGATVAQGDGVTLLAEYPLKSVFVSGPRQRVQAVRKAVLVAGDMGTVSAGFERNLNYELRDEKGAAVTDSHLSIAGEQSQRVRFYLEKEKAVPVVVKTLYGYYAPEEISVSPKTVLVKGDPALVDALPSVVLTTLDETERNAAKFETDVVLSSDDLPTGITLASAQSFRISVDLKDNVARTLQVNLDSAARVTVLKEEGVNVTFEENLISFTVRGPAGAVDGARIEDFQFVVDLRDCKTAGTQKARLQIQPVGDPIPYYPAGIYTVTAILETEG